jgi:hypothetical protein
MTLVELGWILDEMKPGNSAAIRYDMFADLFPPGDPDESARAACLSFAQQHGCRVENKPGLLACEGKLRFVKEA